MKKSKPSAKAQAGTIFGLPEEAFATRTNLFGKTLASGALVLRNTLENLMADETNETRRMVFEQAIAQAEGLAQLSLSLDGMAREAKTDIDEKKKAAYEDTLTQLPNRRAFNERLEKSTATAPLSVLAFDIDKFKTVNDTYGHEGGDEVLKEVAKILQANMRAQDMAARLGGEEFFSILPGVGADDAQKIAERIRGEIERWRGDGVTVPEKITISIGVAQMQADETVESLCKRADDALYAAKNAGRNRVVCAVHSAVKPVVHSAPVL